MSMLQKIESYKERWTIQGYPLGIPDEVPAGLMRENLAPSYKAICLAILKNDHNLKTLGFEPKPSPWYSAIKRIEIAARPKPGPQLELDV